MKTFCFGALGNILLLFYVGFLTSVKAQTPELTKDYKDRTIQTVTELLVNYYVFPEVANKTKQYVNRLNEQGYFQKYQELDSFALALSRSIYKITGDRHISVDRPMVSNGTSIEASEMNRWINERMGERTFFRKFNANFKEVTKLEGNIGFLDLRGFYGLDYGRETADHIMSLLSKSDAIIIDLRYNSGGRGSMSDYLLSYFFEEPVIASETIKRVGDTFEKKTNLSAQKIGGKRMPNIPLFILTSTKTFSAAEGFAYALKAYDRAIIVGEKTKGGANPGDLIPVNDELQIFVPDVSVTHPLTGGSWEGTGIAPDIQINSEQALDTALVLARESAKKFKRLHDAKATKLLKKLDSILTNFDSNQSGTPILDAYLICRDNDLIFEEWEINSLGNQMYQQGRNETATAILKTNTVLYPESPYAFNNYAEVLLKMGRPEKAIPIYKKALAVAKETNHPDLKIFIENLEKYKK